MHTSRSLKPLSVAFLLATITATLCQAGWKDKILGLGAKKEAAPSEQPAQVEPAANPESAPQAANAPDNGETAETSPDGADTESPKSVAELKDSMLAALKGNKELRQNQDEIRELLVTAVNDLKSSAESLDTIYQTLQNGLAKIEERQEADAKNQDAYIEVKAGQQELEDEKASVAELQNVVLNSVAGSKTSQVALQSMLAKQEAIRETMTANLATTYALLRDGIDSLSEVEAQFRKAVATDEATTERVGQLVGNLDTKVKAQKAIFAGLKIASEIAKIQFQKELAEQKASAGPFALVKIIAVEKLQVAGFNFLDKKQAESEAELADMLVFADEASQLVAVIREKSPEMVADTAAVMATISGIEVAARQEIEIRARTDQAWQTFLANIDADTGHDSADEPLLTAK